VQDARPEGENVPGQPVSGPTTGSLYADRLSSQPTLLESGEFGVRSPASPVATSPG
jgi:hypothetical protein